MYNYSAFRSYFLFTINLIYNKINVSTKIYNFYLIFLINIKKKKIIYIIFKNVINLIKIIHV